jgi:hypothetical protein
MYRVVVIIAGALALAACSSTPEWLSLDALKPAPSVDTVRFESEPPGAEAKVSNGQTCRTPCALALPVDTPLTVVFTLNGYQQDSETIDPVAQTGSPAELKPNPVIAQLAPLPPPPKPVKKRSTRKPAAKKKPAPKTTAKPAAQPAAPPPMTTAPAQQAPAPWPAAPKQ